MGSDRRVVVGVLGELAVWLDDRPQPAGHARQRSVLAVLAVEANRVVPVDSLVDRVWGERPPGTARSALRVYLTHLRRALATSGATITRQGSGYALAIEPDTVDLHRFRRFLALAREQADPQRAAAVVADALALWRGEPLAELDTAWAQDVRERLRQERAAAEADRIDWRLECGRHQELLPELVSWTAAHPLDERAACQHMLALYRCGRQADALQHYQRTRHLLAETLGADPSPPLQEMHQRILTADPALTARTPSSTTATSGVSVVPRQLPAPPRQFTGRTDQLAALDAALRQQGTVVISAIGGAGGMGKTWLALAWAYRNLDRFPDGQLFVDLRGFSPDEQPVDAAVAVRGFLDALGERADRIPVDPQAQVARYRSLVAGRRMLIMLDNARDTDQVLPLIPGGLTCTVLVTSRRQLTGLTTTCGSRPVALDALTDTEARQVLVGHLGEDRTTAEPDAVSALLRWCAGLPLALGIVAARATQSGLPLAVLAEELSEPSTRLDALDTAELTANLRAVFSFSHRALRQATAQVFGLLALAPGPDIGLPAAAGLTAVPVQHLRAVLRELEVAHLVQQHAPGRYRMHDLVRLYAIEQAQREQPESDREEALRRLVDHYLHTAFAACRLLEPDRQPIDLDPPLPGCRPCALPDDASARAWLDAERLCLLDVQRQAARHGRHLPVWQLTWALTNQLLRHGHLRDNLALCRTGLAAAVQLGDPTVQHRAHRFLGEACARVGAHDEALAHLRQALTFAEHTGDIPKQAHTHQVLAQTEGRQGDDARALEHATHALRLYRTLDQPIWEATALNLVGWFSAQLGHHAEGSTACQAALTLFRGSRHRPGEAATLDSLGRLAQDAGRHREALDHYRQALALCRDIGEAYWEADTLDHLGHAHAAVGDRHEAHAAWQRALELYQIQHRLEDADRVRRQLDPLS